VTAGRADAGRDEHGSGNDRSPLLPPVRAHRGDAREDGPAGRRDPPAGPGPGARGGRRAGAGGGSPAALTRRGRHRGLRSVARVPRLKGGRGRGERPGSSFHPETGGPAGNDEGRGRAGPFGDRVPRVRPRLGGKAPRAEQPGRAPPREPAAPMPGGYGVMGDDGSMDYSVHEAWNEATNVYLVVILVSFVLFMYAKRNKRKIMRIFSVPPTAETLSESSFYDTISKIRLRQQLEMYSISRKYDYQQPQNQADSVQLSLE
uniref:Small integral membrane protein 19 n=2 Tax=Canis lupus familiaris TaxID=9615 RepID=A0A8I3MZH5_CANLF